MLQLREGRSTYILRTEQGHPEHSHIFFVLSPSERYHRSVSIIKGLRKAESECRVVGLDEPATGGPVTLHTSYGTRSY